MEDNVPIPSVEDLDGMIAYLRHDDTRLIRYDVPNVLTWMRQEKLCSEHLETLMKRLATRFDEDSNLALEDQTKIVQIVTLCSSENPDRRHYIGTFQDSVVLKAVVSLLDEGSDSVTAVVGDAIWILSFADHHNHDYFVEHAIEPMASILVDRADALEKMGEQKSPGADGDASAAALAVMWMAAALQNLAASYCETESGHCWWEYKHPEEEADEDNQEGEYGIYLHEESPVFISAERAAEAIVKAAGGELVPVLHRLVCAEPMTEEDESIWASEATVEGAGSVDPRIITWAVSGLLKNLSVYEESFNATFDAKDCLCALVDSADWLESSKADDALYRSGFIIADCWEHDGEEL